MRYPDPGPDAQAELARIFGSRTQSEWVAVFAEVDCCVTPVLRLEESLAEPQVKAREMVTEVDGTIQFASPFRMGGAETRPACAALGRGSDGEAILGEAGSSAADIETLLAKGVI
ncbi:MAG: CoA transferase [Rhodocyclaceae bacterium]